MQRLLNVASQKIGLTILHPQLHLYHLPLIQRLLRCMHKDLTILTSDYMARYIPGCRSEINGNSGPTMHPLPRWKSMIEIPEQ